MKRIVSVLMILSFLVINFPVFAQEPIIRQDYNFVPAKAFRESFSDEEEKWMIEKIDIVKGFSIYHYRAGISILYEINGKGIGGLTRFTDDNTSFGYKNETGDIVIPCKYTFIMPFYGNNYLARNYIGKSYTEEYKDSDGNTQERDSYIKKWGYVSKNGEEVIPNIYEHLWEFTEDLCAAKLNGKYGYIDMNGNIIIPFQYEDARPFENGVAKVMLNNNWIYIDRDGNNLGEVPEQSENEVTSKDSEPILDYIETENGRLYGYINANNEVVIPYQYEKAQPFSEGLAWVEQKKAIDQNGNVVFELDYEFYRLDDFKNGIALAYSPPIIMPHRYEYKIPINKKGEYILPAEETLTAEQIVYLKGLDWRALYDFSGVKDGSAYCMGSDGEWLIVDKSYIPIVLNNKVVKTDKSPILLNGRTLVPLRAVAESMGCDVGWYEKSQMIVVQRDGLSIEMTINNPILTVIGNGPKKEIALDAAPQLYGDRTMVPIRAIAEELNYQVEWDELLNLVKIHQ